MEETWGGFDSRRARMKLEQCYPLPPPSFGPKPDYYPDPKKMPNLFYCGRMYPCACGKAVTGWRYLTDDVPHLVCSIECLEALIKDEIVKTKGTEAPPVPVADAT